MIERPDDRLTTAEAAALRGVTPGTWRVWVHRGKAPKPDGHIDARTPYWYRSTITESETNHEHHLHHPQ